MKQNIEAIIKKLGDEDAAVMLAELESRSEECERLSDELSYTKKRLNTAVVGLKDLLRDADVPWPFRDIELGGRGAEGHAEIRASIAAMEKERLDERSNAPGVDPKAEYHTPQHPVEDNEGGDQ